MASAKTQPARGMRDFLPAEVRRREYVIGKVKRVYERYGFEPLETPAVENIETLLGKYGEEGNQLIFKILKRGVHEKTGEADLALRYDLTVPLARVFAQHQNEFHRFLKRYQIQPVWRADRPGRGRFREFYQCDVDVVGSSSMIVESELIAAASETLEELNFNNFTIRLNHRQVLTSLLKTFGVSSDKEDAALIALDKLEKIGHARVAEELVQRGVSADAANRILDFFDKAVETERSAQQLIPPQGMPPAASRKLVTSVNEKINHGLLEQLQSHLGVDESARRGLDELDSIIKLTKSTQSGSRVRIDVSLARGISYYTGAIMEINVTDLPGSLGGGGRYDNLIGMFCTKQVPACGFSLGLERIMVVMNERQMFPPEVEVKSVDVMIAIAGEELAPAGLLLADELRQKDPQLRVLVYPQPSDKIQKQRAYGKARRALLELIIDEKGITWLGGEQVDRDRVPDVIKQMLPSIKETHRVEEELARKGVDRLKQSLSDA